MKNKLLALFLCSLTSSVWAASTVDLTVKGTLTNSACTPTLSNGGVVDFGKTSLSTLTATGDNALRAKTITLTITCDAATTVGFVVDDNRADSVSTASSYNFGMGKTAGGVNLGYYKITATTSPMADGVAGIIISSNKTMLDDNSWVKGMIASGIQPEAYVYSVSKTDSNPAVPTAFKVGVFDLSIAPYIQGTDTLNITDDTELDGLATISVLYL
ncbi:DUF1120 domain-containing protein [Lelliottia sp.]|uniref:DUF1120 domain-containing protein n=1 Tax=Lelliottia sp. TaxID=1898429 RepID=UPI00388D325A